jgi:protein SCO1/2
VREIVAAWRRTTAATLAICAIGGALLAAGTDGFRALTSEQARRNAIARAPRSLPDVTLEDQDAKPFTLAEYRGRPVAVNFVYTRCRSICTLSSAAFERIDAAERARARTGTRRLELVSISFDPSDTPARLREYAARYSADGVAWRFARVRDVRELDALLRTFGIIVIPAPGGDFQHNAAVHLVDARGRLARVLDPDAEPRDVASAVASLETERSVASVGRAP